MPNTDPAAPPPISPAIAVPAGQVSWLSAALLAIIITAVGCTTTYVALSRAMREVPTVVVLDAARIANTKIAEISAKAIPPEQAADEGRKFVDSINQAVAPLTDAGYVVVSSGAVLGTPRNADITNAIAKKLGVTLR